ncbi:MFS transporter [Actinopolymorpha pittospori]|uniref:DHA2 family multidrug resistance protein-like MFS transporter n=1 Tax=Actinopolymorpha pittospori TaxID=648752 RepID=A0A927R8V3_9ACTN|nr:MFS transporter [Actinopolymorpha pittospori]MBE1607142.1 DHA2 family multidrug resistance protein-like MFS transporter [Actinopolymorpha pittospori]
MPSDTTALASTRTWCGLLVLLLSALLVSMDISVLFVAGPRIAEDLRLTATEWLWAMDIYSFVMAGLLITMGSLGDRIGRRRLLLVGAATFGVASAVLAYAPSPELLILGRAMLAVGGATLAPSTLSLIRGMFAREDQRRTALGAWTIAFSGGAVAGPIIGGALLEVFWWGAVFLINVPVLALLLLVAPFLVEESRNPERTTFDVLGACTSLVAILASTFALKNAAEHGVDLATLVATSVGALGAAAFVIRQRRTPHPLVELALFRIPRFAAAVGANTVVAMATAGLGVLAFTFLQVVHGLSPLQSAVWALPTFAGTVVGAVTASTLAARIPAAPLLAAGLLAGAAGLAVVAATLEPSTGLWLFLLGYTVLTFGVGLTATIANSLVLTTAPPGRAGAASGISERSTELGAALGIATLGTVAAAIYRGTVAAAAPAGTDPLASETVAGAVEVANGLGSRAATTLLDTAFAAYTDGVSTAALVGALRWSGRPRSPPSPCGAGDGAGWRGRSKGELTAAAPRQGVA